jgi:predicted AAA+ superfamily ATPase
MHGLKRNLEKSITYLMQNFPAVVLLGARQVGKSTLIQRLFPTIKSYDLEREKDFIRIMNDPEFFFNEVPAPYIIDEAQKGLKLFEAIRVNIDQNRHVNGRFLLTGSSSPELLKSISESLAGRCAIVEVNPFSFNEAFQKTKSKFYQILKGSGESFSELSENLTRDELMDLCLHGSYPEPFLKREDHFYFQQWQSNYIQTYIERDIRQLFPNLNLDAFKRFFRMVAFANGEIINYANFARSLDVSQPTIKKYFEILEGTFTWRRIPAFDKNTKKRLIKMPKGYIKDTGLVNFFLNINHTEDLVAYPSYGRLWESFITEQIIKALKEELEIFNFYHYRSSNQAEIDLILEGNFGLIPIEIKSGSMTMLRQLRTMDEFIKNFKCPYGIIINNGDEIFKLRSNIIQIPARYL